MIQFRSPEERAAMRKQRKIRKAMRQGVDTSRFQNVGGEYTYNIGGAALTAGANYNIDTEDFAPTAGIAFKF